MTDDDAADRASATDSDSEHETEAEAGHESDGDDAPESDGDDAHDSTRESAGSLSLSAIDVVRAPGFEHGGFGVEGLSPGVTVVHGPNASGKSTLARACQWVCWPSEAPSTARLVGRFALDGDDWRVDVDAADGTYQRNGQPANAPSLPPATDRRRYELSLHDLLQHETRNEDFAAIVKRESAGGYDLDAAADALGFTDTPSTRRLNVVQDAEDAVDAYRAAKRDAEELRESERRLDALHRELEDAEAARRAVECYEQAIAYAEATADLEAAERELDRFPDALADVDGDEIDAVDDLTERIDEWRETRESAEADRADAEDRLADVDLPEDGVPDVERARLEALAEWYEALEERKARTETKLANATERRETARNDAPVALDADALAELEPATAWADLAEYLQLAETVQADRAMRDAVDRWLDRRDDDRDGDAAPDRATDDPDRGGADEPVADGTTGHEPGTADGPVPAGADVDEATLGRGRQALEQWLANPPRDATAGGTGAAAGGGATGGDGEAGATAAVRIAVVSAVALTVAVIALATLVHPGALAGLLVPAFVLYLAARARRDGSGGSTARDAHRETYQELPLAPPSEWSAAGVRERLTTIYDALADARVDAERERRYRDRRSEIDGLESAEERLQAHRERIQAQFGGDPPETDVEDVELAATVQAIGRWQAAHDEVVGLRAERDRVDAQLADVRQRLEAALDPYDDADLPEAAAATSAVDALADRARRHETASSDLERAEADIAEADAKIADLEAQRDAVYTDLGLDPGARDDLAERCEQADAYADAVAERDRAQVIADTEREQLEAHPEYDPGLESTSKAGLETMKADAEQRADSDVDLREEITEIKTRVADAKADTAVEDARAAKDRALDDLHAQFEADAAAMVGDALVDHVADASRDSGRPPVFERARELLARITHGTYRLDLDADGTAFRAYDTVRERGFALDELSSATQLQVLLAVRVAFVDVTERGPRLPLVLDETLANTDDRRAAVLIDSLLELAREGRQILYVTAQGDEVAKWRAALDATDDVEHAVVDLAAERDLDHHVTVPDLDAVTDTTHSPPDPAGHDHASYGAALDVPAFDPRRGAGAIHCWYLVTDVDVLHALLDLGVDRWGQLATLLDTGYGDVLVDDPDVLVAIERRGRAIEAFVRAWHVGRGDRVEREALEATDAVSDNFIDEVTALAERCDGDAEAILERLRAGEVDRFRSGKIDDLRAYFEDHGYVDPADELDPAALRVRVVDALTTDDRPREDARDEARALFERLAT